MKITVSTAYRGEHKDWTFYQEALDDQGVWELETTELSHYLYSIDGKVDSGGPLWEQVQQAALDFVEGKRTRPYNLTLATNDSEDLDVFVKAEED